MTVPSSDALGDFFAENLGLVFGVDAFAGVLRIRQHLRLFDDLSERRLNAGDHRREESRWTVAPPVLTHALQLLLRIWRFVVELLLDQLVLTIALSILLLQALICTVSLRRILERALNPESFWIYRVASLLIPGGQLNIEHPALVGTVRDSGCCVPVSLSYNGR